jgi:hypothetical protein
MFPSASAKFGAWLFYAILFNSFTPTLLHSSQAENGKQLLEILTNFTENVEYVYEEMSKDMLTKSHDFGKLAKAEIIVKGKKAKKSSYFQSNFPSEWQIWIRERQKVWI